MTYPPEPTPNEPQPPYPPQMYQPTVPQPYSPAPTQYSPTPMMPTPYSPDPQQTVHIVNVQQQPTSGLAVASMVLGILGLLSSCCTFGIFSILAVILGHAALPETKRGKAGHGMAVAGLVMGYVIFVPAVIFSIFVLFGGGLAAITGGSAAATSP